MTSETVEDLKARVRRCEQENRRLERLERLASDDAKRWFDRVGELERELSRLHIIEVFHEEAISERNQAKKRVAELEEQVGGQTIELAKCLQKTVDLQSQLEAKDKRVAELEIANAKLSRRNAEQLAWTPVSAGLPTEPGLYEFLWLHKHPTVGCWRLVADGWVTRDGKPPTITTPYTHYRKIELPEAG